MHSTRTCRASLLPVLTGRRWPEGSDEGQRRGWRLWLRTYVNLRKILIKHTFSKTSTLGAAPHPPFGHLLPARSGEKGRAPSPPQSARPPQRIPCAAQPQSRPAAPQPRNPQNTGRAATWLVIHTWIGEPGERDDVHVAVEEHGNKLLLFASLAVTQHDRRNNASKSWTKALTNSQATHCCSKRWSVLQISQPYHRTKKLR